MSLNGHSADGAPGVAVLHGTLAASVTPLLQGGAAIDEDDRPCLADVDERLRQLCDRGRVEGISGLGSCKDDPEDIVIPFDT